MTSVPPTIAEKIDLLFPPEQREAARRMLVELGGKDLPCAGSNPSPLLNSDRVCFAVLKLSRGELNNLRREIDQAYIDWRDTLMAAGFGENINAHLAWNSARQA